MSELEANNQTSVHWRLMLEIFSAVRQKVTFRLI